jgi:transposase-like protein
MAKGISSNLEARAAEARIAELEMLLEQGKKQAHEAIVAERRRHEESQAESQAKLAKIGVEYKIAEAKRVAVEAKLAKAKADLERLRDTYRVLLEQHELLRRKLFCAKAERIDVAQLTLQFEASQKKVDAAAKAIVDACSTSEEEKPSATTDVASSGGENGAPPSPAPEKPKRPPSKGRRNLRECDLREVRMELFDPSVDPNAEVIAFEESCRLAYHKPEWVRVVVARATYKLPSEDKNDSASEKPGDDANASPTSKVTLRTTPLAPEVHPGLLAPSSIAHILVMKYRFGMPFHRLVELLRSRGLSVDDGTMCRYAENVGATLGSVVLAMAEEAKRTAFCLSTDATGVSIQPSRVDSKSRQSCEKGHFFVVLADRDHVFFEYQKKHTSEAVCGMFRGFKGYIQADASSVYDALFCGDDFVDGKRVAFDALPEASRCRPSEVGCWAHARRRFWEAAVVSKDGPSQKMLLKLRTMFELEEKWKDLPPTKRQALRAREMRPLVDDFFAECEATYARIKDVRGLATTAFGYAVRQKHALVRFLENGALKMTNNDSERTLRHIAAGRKSWLFFGSDDHANAAANLFSLIASCKLHGLDPETYLAELIHVLPQWPLERHLELAPKYWAATRARIAPDELAREFGFITVPPQIPAE